MSDATSHSPASTAQWQAILSLGILHAVFVFSNLAYDQNQTIILQRHGLVEYNHLLETSMLVLSCLIPPFAGWLSDRYAITRGKRYLVISVAVVVTALLFMAVALGYSLQPGSALARMLPFMMVFWVTGMLFFHSPTHSFVREYAPKNEWPLANSIILLVAGIITASEELIAPLLDTLGVAKTFISGGLLLALSAWWFVRSGAESAHSLEKERFSIGQWQWPLAYGALTGLVVTLFDKFLHLLQNDSLHPGESNPYLTPSILVILAFLGIPVGQYASKVGTKRLFRTALPVFAVAAAVGFGMTGFVPIWLALVFLGLAFSALRICGLPMALQYAANGNPGFTVGVFWAGFNLIPVLALLLE